MRALGTLCLLLGTIISGCLATGPTETTSVASPTTRTTGPTQSSAAGACASGAQDRALDVQWGLGFTGPESVPTPSSLTHEGQLYHVESTRTQGSGKVSAASGALHGITLEQAKAELVRWHDIDPHWNYTIGMAFRVVVSQANFTKMCSVIVPDFYALNTYYNQEPNVADGGTLTMQVSTTRGDHSVSAYDGEGPPAFKAAKDTFFGLVEQAKKDLGISS